MFGDKSEPETQFRAEVDAVDCSKRSKAALGEDRHPDGRRPRAPVGIPTRADPARAPGASKLEPDVVTSAILGVGI